ncbi:MAG: tyrosine--tRNA ligase [Bacilli bacterium]|nr:tyrosine--tRNA ligase [Bacilli bacterium]
MKLYEELKWRGLIKDEAGDDLKDKLDNEKVTFYWGTDPSADSLHIGHYSSLLTAKRLAKRGHHPILLIGGATGMIGDPRPTSEREIQSKEVIKENTLKIKKQVEDIFDGNVEVVNNYDWTKDINILDFLRDIGKHVNVNYIINKDIIKRRLDTGITFAEFTYTLLQGYDFLHLYESKNCIMQVEGSDQWGNITTGIELISKKLNKKAYAFTMPLILDSNGKKFGKSEGNALWLDKSKTSSYEIYQYLINSSDEKVEEYLKVYTFLNKEEIENIMNDHLKSPEKRLAQKTLARELIKDLRGEDEAKRAEQISESLFKGRVKDLTKEEIEVAFKNVSTFSIENDINILDMLTSSKIASSKREAREFVSAGSITINESRITDLEFTVSKDIAIDEEILVVRRGKKKYFLGKIKN